MYARCHIISTAVVIYHGCHQSSPMIVAAAGSLYPSVLCSHDVCHRQNHSQTNPNELYVGLEGVSRSFS